MARSTPKRKPIPAGSPVFDQVWDGKKWKRVHAETSANPGDPGNKEMDDPPEWKTDEIVDLSKEAVPGVPPGEPDVDATIVELDQEARDMVAAQRQERIDAAARAAAKRAARVQAAREKEEARVANLTDPRWGQW